VLDVMLQGGSDTCLRVLSKKTYFDERLRLFQSEVLNELQDRKFVAVLGLAVSYADQL